MSGKLLDIVIRMAVIGVAALIALAMLGAPTRVDDWLKFIGLSFAAHAFLQLVLRYALLPDPKFRLVDAAAHPLGHPEPSPEEGLEGEALDLARHQNWLRGFLILGTTIEHQDAPRWIRAFGSRTPVGGAAVRFRYCGDGTGDHWTEWRFGRWGDVIQPLDTAGKIDLRAVETNHRLPRLYPSDLQDPERPWHIAFAMKRKDEAEFYHFNDRSYLYGPGWRNPDWVLPAGTYEIEAELVGHGLSHKRQCKFWLICSATEFRISVSRPPQPATHRGSIR